MPELPEVEYAARHLRRWLQGRRIESVEADPNRIFRPHGPAEISQALQGRQLQQLDRRAKYLLFTFDGGAGAVAHLGMTGKWLRRPPSSPPPHSRLRLFLDDGSVVHYRDPRMFGQFSVMPAEKLWTFAPVAKLGPDPLVDGLDAALLGDRLRRTSRPAKIALMDQALVGGLGNIQAAEALWRAKVNPRTPAKRLTPAEVERLARGIHESIRHSLDSEGDEDEIEYVEEGGQNPFSVYGRKGEPCPRCRTPIATFDQGGRTTYYCPACQGSGKPSRKSTTKKPARTSTRPRHSAKPSKKRSAR